MESTRPLDRPPPSTPLLAIATTTASEETTSAPQFTLCIKELPSALSSDAVTSLLSHYGASVVRVLKRKKPGATLRANGGDAKVSQVAIAEFPSRQRMLEAQQRLARVQLAGKKLVVEVIQSTTDSSGDATTTATSEKPPGKAEGGRGPVEAPTPPPPHQATAIPVANPNAPRRQNRHHAPAPLAPHLGLHYAPSPLLTYKYPKASVPVVRNIANALMALPRFYTQVLHLMNKMNLPTPFEPGAIPGVFSEEFMVDTRQQQRLQSRLDQRHVAHGSTQEMEEEEDEDEEANGDDQVQRHTKRPRVDSNTSTVSMATSSSKKRPRGASHTQTAAAFDDSEELRRRAALKPPRPGVISAAELDRQRLTAAELARNPAFAGYAAGNPALQVHVSNIAESVDAKDLEYVVGHVLPLDSALESLAIDLQPAIASAVVSYPSLESAQRAVQVIHGVVLDGRPLCVRYNHAQVVAEPEPTGAEIAVEPALVEDTPRQISSKWERMEVTELAAEKAMKNYSRGEPTLALYIKNLAKAVDEASLRSLAREFSPSSVSAESLTIRHFTEGRMKNQAFIEFPGVDAASAVLEQIHGLVLHGKPLVVSFRKAQTPAPS